MRRYLLPLLGLIPLALATPAGAIAPGQPLPAFELPRVGGGAPVKSGQLAGQVALVTFWATWCPDCRAEIPAMNRLYAKYKAKGFTVVGLSVDTTGEPDVRKFAGSHAMNYPLAMADDGTQARFGGIREIPNAFLVDRHGKVVKHYLGVTSTNAEQVMKGVEHDLKALL